ncbi:HlyD family efflux transporter periplasmic adaptor subunit, partial [Variovorax sp. CT11-76]
HRPADGLVTNLDLRQGSYAAAGRPVLALVDARSFYVEGYFEETKLPRIHLGDRVHVMPMGGGAVLGGTVESVAAGIADRDRSTSANLLPSVNPTFNWVRLAQRIPVRVKLDPLPAGARLVASVCTGVFLLAASGVVTDQAVTTHWEDLADLRERFPALEVREGVRWVDGGRILSSAGISAGIDVSLHLVERLAGRELAERTARQMDYAWTHNPP